MGEYSSKCANRGVGSHFKDWILSQWQTVVYQTRCSTLGSVRMLRERAKIGLRHLRDLRETLYRPERGLRERGGDDWETLIVQIVQNKQICKMHLQYNHGLNTAAIFVFHMCVGLAWKVLFPAPPSSPLLGCRCHTLPYCRPLSTDTVYTLNV